MQVRDVANLMRTGYDEEYVYASGQISLASESCWRKCGMDDTSQSMKELFHRKLMERNGEERVAMGAHSERNFI